MRLLMPLLFATVLANGSSVHANPQPLAHDGFLLRFALGFGYEELFLNDGVGRTISISGFGIGSGLALGGVVAENLAVHGDLFGSSVFSPNVAMNGQHLGEADDSSTSLTAIGPGITYWVMPLNLYLSGTIGIGKANITTEGSSTDADWGFALQAYVGKEFWVDDEWGLGFAAQLMWADVPTTSDDASASYFAFNICLSATYN